MISATFCILWWSYLHNYGSISSCRAYWDTGGICNHAFQVQCNGGETGKWLSLCCVSESTNTINAWLHHSWPRRQLNHIEIRKLLKAKEWFITQPGTKEISTWFELTGELFFNYLIYGHAKDSSTTTITTPSMPTIVSPPKPSSALEFSKVLSKMAHSTKNLLMTGNGLYGTNTWNL